MGRKEHEPINPVIIDKTKELVNSSDSVLAFGCRSGAAALALASRVKSIKGIDISSKMIALAKGKAAEHKVRYIDFVQVTIFNEKFHNGSFDVILGFYLLHLLKDAPKIMHRINDLLRPGGLVISATPCIRGTCFGFLLSPLSKIGLIHPITEYNLSELAKLMTDEDFDIVGVECLHKSGQQYFIVAKKSH